MPRQPPLKAEFVDQGLGSLAAGISRNLTHLEVVHFLIPSPCHIKYLRYGPNNMNQLKTTSKALGGCISYWDKRFLSGNLKMQEFPWENLHFGDGYSTAHVFTQESVASSMILSPVTFTDSFCPMRCARSSACRPGLRKHALGWLTSGVPARHTGTPNSWMV